MKDRRFKKQSFAHPGRNSKKHWKNSGESNAFKYNLDYHVRMNGLRSYYQRVDHVIRRVYKIVDEVYTPDHDKKVKAQLSVCYTNYPSALAMLASLGHTAIVQYQALTGFDRRRRELFVARLAEYEYSAGFAIDQETYKKLVSLVDNVVKERVVYEELKRSGLEQPMEAYRFFLASYNPLKFNSLQDVLRAVVLLGELLPDPELMELHPFTKKLLIASYEGSRNSFKTFEVAEKHELFRIGQEWTKALCRSLVEYIPAPDDIDDNGEKENPRLGFAKGQPQLPRNADEEFPGLNKPHPPLFEKEAFEESMIREFTGNGKLFKKQAQASGEAVEEDEDLKEFLKAVTDATKTLMQSSGQSSGIEDIRSDILIDKIMDGSFEAGPLQGTPVEGNEVEIDLGFEGKFKGEIHDQSFELSNDLPAIEQLVSEAQPLTNRMKKNIFPNQEDYPIVENLKATGSLDKERLAYHAFSDAIHKRYKIKQVNNKRGKPVILIVCDGSGSMGADKMHMLKILTCAWINSTLNTSVQVMAGMYRDGGIGNGRYGAKVEWIFHPGKTPAKSKRDAVRTLVNLPKSGGGGQQDALSLGFMLSEADKFARGKRIYMIHITDTGWCTSFKKGLSAEEEVVGVLAKRKEDHGDNFHYTLVGLGINSGGRVEHYADKMICLPSGELSSPMAAASKIGIYVSSCLKERSRSAIL